jgi:hypothetical protein
MHIKIRSDSLKEADQQIDPELDGRKILKLIIKITMETCELESSGPR